MSASRVVQAFVLTAVLPALIYAQAPAGAPAKPDSPEVRGRIEKAKQTAGAQWAEEARFFCEAPRGNSPNDPVITPTKIFDNVYVIGNAGTVVYVLETSEALVMFDSMTAAQMETQLLPGFQTLGLDPGRTGSPRSPSAGMGSGPRSTASGPRCATASRSPSLRRHRQLHAGGRIARRDRRGDRGGAALIGAGDGRRARVGWRIGPRAHPTYPPLLSTTLCSGSSRNSQTSAPAVRTAALARNGATQ